MSFAKNTKIANTTKLILTSFLIITVLGGVLLNLPIANLKPHDFLNSLFTSAASVCVAGLSTSPIAEQYTMFGKIVILCLIQIGALGFIFILTAFLMIIKRRISYKDQINIGSIFGTSQNIDKVMPLIRRILLFTITCELCGTLALMLRFVPIYGIADGIGQSLFTSVSAFCNCGYDLLGSNSLINYATDYLVTGTCGILTVLGSLGFVIWNEIIEKIESKNQNKASNRKFWLTLSTNCKLVLTMLGIMIVAGTLGFLMIEYNNPETIGNLSLGDKIFVSLFHGISSRTTGMAAVDISSLTVNGKIWTIIMMLIGGNSGSTAGGLKTVTIAVLFLTMISSVSGNKNVTVYGREISSDVIKQAVSVFMLALLIIILATMTLCTLNPQIAFIDVLFEVVSAIATCGYSCGVTPILTPFSKFLIILIMYLGRVSTVTFAMAVAGKKFKQSKIISLPKADINIG